MRDIYYEAAREFVSEVLGEPVTELPAGTPATYPGPCVLEAALGQGSTVGCRSVVPRDGARTFMPPLVREFVVRFDRGEYSELLADGVEVHPGLIAPQAGLDGPSRTIIVEPVEQPARQPEPVEVPAVEPEREPEKVPA